MAQKENKTGKKGHKKMACVLAEAERVYGAHGVPFFTAECAYVSGKKVLRFPQAWQRGDARALTAISFSIDPDFAARSPAHREPP